MTSAERPLTDAQKRALLWLEPGKSSLRVPRTMFSNFISLRKQHSGLVVPRCHLGRRYPSWELTPAGIAAREKLLAERDGAA